MLIPKPAIGHDPELALSTYNEHNPLHYDSYKISSTFKRPFYMKIFR